MIRLCPFLEKMKETCCW